MHIGMLLAALTLTAVALTSATAQAECGWDCETSFETTLDPMHTRIAADGVLAFSIMYGRADTAIEHLTVSVRNAGGEEVAGTLELNADFSLILWRPTAPWVPGEYTAISRVDTLAWSTAVRGTPSGDCLPYDHGFEFVVEADPLPAPAAPAVLVETEYDLWRDDSLEALVCCDGAMPYLTPGPGSCPSDMLTYSEGACTPMRERGVLIVRYTLDAALPAAVAGNFTWRLRSPDGDGIGNVLSSPRCLRLEILDIARGEVFIDERCHGDDVADQLGAVPIDPSPELTSCAGPTYVCEVHKGSDRWDETRCVTWPDGAPFEVPEPGAMEPDSAGETATEDGCGCTTGHAPAALLVLALPLLARRRRR